MASAIFTKYLGPTTFRGSRIKAWAMIGKTKREFTMEYQPQLSQIGNHRLVTEKLATLLGWTGYWYAGDMPGTGYVFVRTMTPDDSDALYIPSDGVR